MQVRDLSSEGELLRYWMARLIVLRVFSDYNGLDPVSGQLAKDKTKAAA